MVGAVAVDEHQVAHLGLHKARGDQVGGEATIPSLECLLQAIEGLVEPAHQVGVSGINEDGGLVAIDCLDERIVEEGVLNIRFMNRPVLRESQS
jgi:hypothetical protein